MTKWNRVWRVNGGPIADEERVVGFGWAKPVPVNPYTLRRSGKAASMLVSIAGPLANLFLAILAAIPLRFNLVSDSDSFGQYSPDSLLCSLSIFYTLNLGLMIFNLLPIPPLDGHEILSFLLPPDLAARWESFGSPIWHLPFDCIIDDRSTAGI